MTSIINYQNESKGIIDQTAVRDSQSAGNFRFDVLEMYEQKEDVLIKPNSIF
jgi:hypothetical protein